MVPFVVILLHSAHAVSSLLQEEFTAKFLNCIILKNVRALLSGACPLQLEIGILYYRVNKQLIS